MSAREIDRINILQATLRAVLPDVVTLDDLGRRVNNIFYSEALYNRYATLFFAQLEHDSGQLRYLNAGHNPPFVIRADRLHAVPESMSDLGAALVEPLSTGTSCYRPCA